MPIAKAKRPQAAPQQRRITVFPSELGWIAILGQGETLSRLVFGFDTADAALAALQPARTRLSRAGDDEIEIGDWNKPLMARLQAFARGNPDDFRDVRLDLGERTEFQRRVLAACRKVKYGQVSSYAQLAIAAGAPRAARAVGTVMSTNCVPLIIPCHRILSASGGIGGYSSPQGLSMKKRLLALEARAMAQTKQAKSAAGGTTNRRTGKRPARSS